MADILIRNLPDEIHAALKQRARDRHRTTQAEVRSILEGAVRRPDGLRLGTALVEMARRAGLTDADVAVIEQARDKTPAEPLHFD